MNAIHPCPLPEAALLSRYANGITYTDCFRTDIPRAVSHAEYIEAFYTGAVFKLERLILRIAVARPSTDAQARELAQGTRESFSAWTVEARAPDQLLMCDMHERTRSWLMTARTDDGQGTRLYFGSAVVPVPDQSGEPHLGFPFSALLGFHKLYSRILLGAARSRLARMPT